MKALFNRVKEAVNSFIEYIREYNKTIAEIEADARLSQLAKDEKISNEAKKRNSRIEELRELASEALKALVEKFKTESMSCDFDYDVLASRINLIKALDGKITDEVEKDIINTFKDNKQALSILRAVFASYELKCNKIDALLTGPEAVEAQAQQIENTLFFMSQDGRGYVHNDALRGYVDDLEELLFAEDEII